MVEAHFADEIRLYDVTWPYLSLSTRQTTALKCYSKRKKMKGKLKFPLVITELYLDVSPIVPRSYWVHYDWGMYEPRHCIDVAIYIMLSQTRCRIFHWPVTCRPTCRWPNTAGLSLYIYRTYTVMYVVCRSGAYDSQSRKKHEVIPVKIHICNYSLISTRTVSR